MKRKILFTLLMMLIFFACGKYRARDELAKLGVDFTEENFVTAVQKNDTLQINLFLDAGMKPIAKAKDGRSVLIIATANANYKIVERFLKNGADPNYQLESGMAPLMYAANQGNDKMILLLLENGADPNKQELGGRSALHFATLRGSLRSVEALLEHEADPNQQDKHGMTPLIRAAMKNYIGISEALLKNGADPEISDKFRRNAYFFARKFPDSELSEIIEQAVAENRKNQESENKEVF